MAWYNADLPWTFGILFATALADLLLFMFVGNALMCYRCEAQYRGVAEMETHGQFNLETHEKYRRIAAQTARSSLRRRRDEYEQEIGITGSRRIDRTRWDGERCRFFREF